MTSMPSVLRSLFVVVILFVISCTSQIWEELQNDDFGAVPLRGMRGSAKANAQMRRFLVGCWDYHTKALKLRTNFTDDGRFVIEITQSGDSVDLQKLFRCIWKRPEASRR